MKGAIYTSLLILFLLGGFSFEDEPQQNSKLEATPKAEAQEKEAAPVAAAAFANPSLICDALADEGLPPLPKTRWKNIEGIGYNCVSDDLEVTPGGYQYVGDVANTITYCASSDVEDRVQMVRLTANIFNEKREQPVVDKFKELTQELFNQLDLAIPNRLLASIDQGSPQTYQESYGTVTLSREKYKLGYGLQLTIKEGSYLKSLAVSGESNFGLDPQKVKEFLER
jgi:hypothetical protein